MTRTVTLTFDDGSQHVYHNVPDDVTPDAVESRAMSEFPGMKLRSIDGGRFEQTPGGAATGNPNASVVSPEPITRQSGGSRLGTIGGAGVLGGIAGYAAPEILTGLGAAAGAFPLTAPAAPALLGTANLIRGARGASAIAGAIGGMTGEAAGQAAEASGASPVVAEAVRFVGGAVGPETVNLGRWAIKKVLEAPALTMQSKFNKEVAKRIMATLESRPQDLSDEEKQYLDKLITELRGGPKSGQPAADVYGALQASANRSRVMSADAAKQVLDEADKLTTARFNEAIAGPVQRLREASGKLQEIGNAALNAAQSSRLSMAPEREMSDIGGDLRQVIVSRNQRAVEARRAQFAADEQARNAVVQQRESAGQSVAQTPEYQELVSFLNSQLKPGVRSPDVQSGLRHILNQIRTSPTQGEQFMGYEISSGSPGNVSFQQLDDVRRKLGDVFKGQAAEGYDAIGEAYARQLYGKISDIQKKFAGPAQERLLQQYADATDGLQMFGSRFGKKATALDRFDDSIYSTDAARLPKDFFKSKEGVQALRDLTGDPKLVTEKAHEFAVRELAGKTDVQVRSWMTANRELLAAEPELYKSVLKYANTLQRGERISANAQRGVDRIAQREKTSIINMTRENEATIRDAERIAAGLKSSGEKAASILEGRGPYFKEDVIRKLLMSGDTSQWQLAAEAIKRDPRAVGSFANAVRQAIAQRAYGNSKGLGDWFTQNVRPAVEQTGLMTAREADEIGRQIAAIENMKIPDPEKLGLTRRILLQSVGSYAAGAASRATAAAADAAAKWVPE